MEDNQVEQIAQIFKQQCAGKKLTAQEVKFLQGALDRMNEAERAGTIGAIIKIMLG